MQAQSYQTFKVPSSGQPGTTYEVRLHNDGVATCSCPHFTYRRVASCKHIRLTEIMFTTPGRSGALVAQHEAQQVIAETGLTHTMLGIDAGAGRAYDWTARCVCGWYAACQQSQDTALRALATHVGAARQGERAAERAAWYDAAVQRITRVVG